MTTKYSEIVDEKLTNEDEQLVRGRALDCRSELTTSWVSFASIRNKRKSFEVLSLHYASSYIAWLSHNVMNLRSCASLCHSTIMEVAQHLYQAIMIDGFRSSSIFWILYVYLPSTCCASRWYASWGIILAFLPRNRRKILSLNWVFTTKLVYFEILLIYCARYIIENHNTPY